MPLLFLIVWEKALAEVSCNVFVKHLFLAVFSLVVLIKERVYVGNGEHIYLQKKLTKSIKIFYLAILNFCGCLGQHSPALKVA